MKIYQTTKGLAKGLAISGCYFLDILVAFEEEAKIELTKRQINLIFKTCKKFGYVDHEAYIKEKAIQGIAQVASTITKVHVYMELSNKNKYNHIIAMYQRRTSKGKKVTHFVKVKIPTLEITHDPYSPAGSRTAREGKVISYRYIFAEVF